MSSTIESVLHREPRVPARPRSSSRRRTFPAWTPTRRCAPRPSATSRASGRSTRARELLWQKPFTQDARRVERAVLQVVRRRRAERVVQLPRPAPRDAARQGRDHLRGGRRHRHARSPTRSSTTSVCQFANALKSQGHQEGRPRAHLHADVDRGGRRDAGLRAHRRHALGRVRRLLGEERPGAHRRRRRRRGHHRRRAVPRRQARSR